MSTERYDGTLRFACDSCDEFEEFHGDVDWKDAWGQLKRSGWRTRKIAKEWLHGCPRCGVPT